MQIRLFQPATGPGFCSRAATGSFPLKAPRAWHQWPCSPAAAGASAGSAPQKRRIALAANSAVAQRTGASIRNTCPEQMEPLVANLKGDRRALFSGPAAVQPRQCADARSRHVALLAEMLCMVLVRLWRALHLQVAMIPAGYGGHLAMQTFLLMVASNDYANPVAAPWLTPHRSAAGGGGTVCGNRTAPAQWRQNWLGQAAAALARTQPLFGVRCACSTCPLVSSRP